MVFYLLRKKESYTVEEVLLIIRVRLIICLKMIFERGYGYWLNPLSAYRHLSPRRERAKKKGCIVPKKFPSGVLCTQNSPPEGCPQDGVVFYLLLKKESLSCQRSFVDNPCSINHIP